MTVLQVQKAMDVPIKTLCDALWNIQQLQRIWEPITQFSVEYDDGIHQECTMQVERNAQIEKIRIIRFRCDWEILFFNPDPPPMMRFHHGVWRLQPLGTGCSLVVAEREYELLLLPEESIEEFGLRQEQFQLSFRKRLSLMLARFEAYYAPAQEAVHVTTVA
jgi:hypothetical protein